MPRKLTSLLLVPVLLLVLPGAGVASGSPVDDQADAASKIKERVSELSAAQSPVKVKLKAGTKVTGRVSDVGEDTFVLTDAKSGARTTIAYADVVEVKENRGVSKGWIIAAVAASVAAAVVVAVVVAGQDIDIQ